MSLGPRRGRGWGGGSSRCSSLGACLATRATSSGLTKGVLPFWPFLRPAAIAIAYHHLSEVGTQAGIDRRSLKIIYGLLCMVSLLF